MQIVGKLSDSIIAVATSGGKYGGALLFLVFLVRRLFPLLPLFERDFLDIILFPLALLHELGP